MPQDKRRQTSYRINKGVNQKSSQYTLGEEQVHDLYNMDFNKPNALSKRPGFTNMVTANTSGPVNGLFEFERLGGASYMMVGTDTAMFQLSGGSLSPIATGYSNNQPFDFVAFTDRAFFTNGQTMTNWNGSSLFQYMLPAPNSFSLNYGAGTASNGLTTFGLLAIGNTSMITVQRFTYTRHDGYEGPHVGDQVIDVKGNHTGGTLGVYPPGITSPPNVSYINFYMAINLSDLSFGGLEDDLIRALTGFSYNASLLPAIPNTAFRFITTYPLGTTFALIAPNAFVFNSLVDIRRPLRTFAFDFTATYTPRYIEISQNRLFMSGFSTAPSVVFFSEIGEPEKVAPESFFEVRTDDSDIITGQVDFQDNMLFFKRNSFHRLVGDSADNYSLQTLSTEYGCLSNKAIAEYNNILLFLDEKGIVEYNGSNWNVISHTVEPVLRRMNITAARETAVAIHYDFRNQVWFGIPVDGSTRNNMTIVYDYLLNAWTFFDGFQPASFAMAKRELTIDRLWFGDYSGNVHHFSPSFYGDNGQAITCIIDTKFDSPDGANIQNMFRRLFVDTNKVTGVTGAIDVEVYRDYDRTTQATFTIYQNQFQTRKDFGVQGKSVAFKMTHKSASLPFDFYGYTVQRKYLREV